MRVWRRPELEGEDMISNRDRRGWLSSACDDPCGMLPRPAGETPARE